MGNIAGKLTPCLCTTTTGEISRRYDISVILNQTFDDSDNFGHSFCYLKPENIAINSNKTTPPNILASISGSSISANTLTPLSTSLLLDSTSSSYSSSFSSSPSFASVSLQPVPRNCFINSGPLPARKSGSSIGSGLIERGFFSGPIERGFVSGSLKMEKYKVKKWGSIKNIKDSIINVFLGDENTNNNNNNNNKRYDYINNNNNIFSGQSLNSCEENCDFIKKNNIFEFNLEYKNVEWAEGKAGEDRVQIVVSENNGWVFVGIYDGFNGPDGPDFLLSNLYCNVYKELNGLLVSNNEDKRLKVGSEQTSSETSNQSTISNDSSCSWCEISRCDGQVLDLDEKVREKLSQLGMDLSKKTNHSDVLNALSNALRKTEEEYLDIADKMVKENPELSLMGSCVLVMLMVGDDVYLMNVGDSRAVLGQKSSILDTGSSFDDFSSFTPLQLTVDHNTQVKEEVERIREEHPDDPSAIVNDRVKGSLKVTRAFGAGFLKKPKWNDALLEMFQIDYVGTSPYLTSSPSLIHRKLSPKDKFVILSSDGLYQYMTNEEVVSDVELFMSSTPEGDPAQHLIEEVLFRAAKKAGMDFYELLEIPQGERRRYHDDVSVIVISLEGRIWRSSV